MHIFRRYTLRRCTLPSRPVLTHLGISQNPIYLWIESFSSGTDGVSAAVPDKPVPVSTVAIDAKLTQKPDASTSEVPADLVLSEEDSADESAPAGGLAASFQPDLASGPPVDQGPFDAIKAGLDSSARNVKLPQTPRAHDFVPPSSVQSPQPSMFRAASPQPPRPGDKYARFSLWGFQTPELFPASYLFKTGTW